MNLRTHLSYHVSIKGEKKVGPQMDLAEMSVVDNCSRAKLRQLCFFFFLKKIVKRFKIYFKKYNTLKN